MEAIRTLPAVEKAPLLIAGGNYRVLLPGSETYGKLAIIEMRVPAGKGPVPHRHPGFSETFYVAEGLVEFHTKSGSVRRQSGESVFIPMDGEAHNFTNVSDSEAVLICTVQPAGLDDFFTEADALLQGNPPDESAKIKLQELAITYGQELFQTDQFTRTT